MLAICKVRIWRLILLLVAKQISAITHFYDLEKWE